MKKRKLKVGDLVEPCKDFSYSKEKNWLGIVLKVYVSELTSLPIADVAACNTGKIYSIATENLELANESGKIGNAHTGSASSD